MSAVVILGATSRIGQALAREFASAGFPVVLCARDLAEAGRIAADVTTRHGVTAEAVAFDACDFSSHGPTLSDVARRFGGIHVGVIAYGDMGDQGESELDFAAARRVIDINFTGAASAAEALYPLMAAARGGTIVGVASVAGERGRRSNYVYGSAKGAFAMYLDGLRGRGHKDGVRVLTVKLGFVDTRMTFPMATKIPKASPEAAARAIREAVESGVESMFYPPFWAPVMAIIRALPPALMKRLPL